MPTPSKIRPRGSISRKGGPIEKGRWAAKGTKPVPEPMPVLHVMSMMVVFLCKKIVFVTVEYKLVAYVFGLFVVSVIGDVLPYPKTYFADKHNVFNKYFVKWGWAWTIVPTTAFVYMTSVTYCCGKMDRVKKHLIRSVLATLIWKVGTMLIDSVETLGFCEARQEKFQVKEVCLEAGYVWKHLSISGHAFMLIHCTLFIFEEAKAIQGWENIKELVRIEYYMRFDEKKKDSEADDESRLKPLTDEELVALKESYDKFTLPIRVLFVLMSFLSCIWDVMLLATILYFHSMVEKLIGGVSAICCWFIMYRMFYTQKFSPGLPGQGLFKYGESKVRATASARRRESIRKDILEKRRKTINDKVPTFCGMPLYALQQTETQRQPQQPPPASADDDRS